MVLIAFVMFGLCDIKTNILPGLGAVSGHGGTVGVGIFSGGREKFERLYHFFFLRMT